MNDAEGKKYTAREAASHLALIQDHLADYNGRSGAAASAGFCLECLGKHFSSLRGLAAEGESFFPGDAGWWHKLRAWTDETMDAFQSASSAEGATAHERKAVDARMEFDEWPDLSLYDEVASDEAVNAEDLSQLVYDTLRDARTWRKELQGKYFGRLGQCSANGKGSCDRKSTRSSCSCITGTEACCHGRSS